MAKRDTELLGVGFRDMRERSKINVILDEGLSILAETELTESILNRLIDVHYACASGTHQRHRRLNRVLPAKTVVHRRVDA